MNVLDRVASLKRARAELVAVLKQDATKDIAAMLQKMPEGVDGVLWIQYTPYFNDGETCEFWFHEDTVTPFRVVDGIPCLIDEALELEDDDEDYGYRYPEGWSDRRWDNETRSYVPREDVHVEAYSVYAEIRDYLLALADADLLRDVFGDHVQVTVFRDGRYETEYHEHD
jgi:hypothetical protein